MSDPIRINIHGSTVGYAASEWCLKQFGNDGWEMWIGYSWSHYIFEFSREQDATLFALRWLEYA